eukprot:6491605-Amphidinium_carterae.1
MHTLQRTLVRGAVEKPHGSMQSHLAKEHSLGVPSINPTDHAEACHRDAIVRGAVDKPHRRMQMKHLAVLADEHSLGAPSKNPREAHRGSTSMHAQEALWRA